MRGKDDIDKHKHAGKLEWERVQKKAQVPQIMQMENNDDMKQKTHTTNTTNEQPPHRVDIASVKRFVDAMCCGLY
jgi:hypothetical protein